MVKSKKTFDLVLAAVLSALIIVMTVVPYTGYINYGTFVEITTLHIVVIVGAAFLDWKYGAVLGAVWGITCFFRAFTNPAWVLFTNPLISILPRILVGIVAGLVFSGFSKTKLNTYASAGLTAIAATLTNTVLVLSAIYIFGGMIKSYAEFFELFKTIFVTIIGVNGLIELIAAAVLVPTIYLALTKIRSKN
jgi:uncharacterized membrane protein